MTTDSVRRDGDGWDLASGVGAMATAGLVYSGQRSRVVEYLGSMDRADEMAARFQDFKYVSAQLG